MATTTAGGLEATHPQYDGFVDAWVTMRDLYDGERAVKAKRDRYLPPTPSMLLDGFGKGESKIGEKIYAGYLQRALFPDYVNDAVQALVGMLNHKQATIELPKVLEPLLNDATLQHESLHDLLRRIHTEQLTTGRIGLLADLPAAPAATAPTPDGAAAPAPVLPYIATYIAEAIRNWDEADDQEGYIASNLVVLNESGFSRQADFTWKTFKRYRVLQLGVLAANEDDTGGSTYTMGVFDDLTGALSYSEAGMQTPLYRGKKLTEIPFVFVNTRDLMATPDLPPLEGLGKHVLAIYRGEADYRQSLFMTGQDTLVVVGGVRLPDGTAGLDDDAIRTGAGSRIDVDIGGDAKYIGVSPNGLSEQRQSLENDRKYAQMKSGQLIEGKSKQESGEALKTRLTAQTATLNQIALTSAKALENLLKLIARWVGANDEEVKVAPNMEFGELNLTATDIQGLMAARLTGAPLSKKSIHALMVEKRLTSMTYEDEMEQIQEEDADMPRVAAGAGTLTAEEQLAQQEAERQAAADAADKKAAQGAAGKGTAGKPGAPPVK